MFDVTLRRSKRRGRLRRVAAALAWTLLTPWLAAGAQTAGASAPAPPSQDSPFYREYGYVTLHDGVRIAYVAYRPTKEGNGAWPPAEARPQAFYLTGDALLSATKPASAEQTAPRTYTYPTGTELIGSNAQFSLPVEPEGVLVYRSLPMTQDLTILGAPQLTVNVSIAHEDADFVVDLHDLYPNGDVQYLQRGLLRASMRAIDPVRSRPDAIRHRFDKRDPLVPGKAYEIKMSLPPIGAVIREGHRLEVTIMAPSPIAQPDWGFQPAGQPGRNTVYHSADRPSVLTVPVIPNARAQGPAPVCGSLDFQPCRPANTIDQLMFIVKPKIVP